MKFNIRQGQQPLPLPFSFSFPLSLSNLLKCCLCIFKIQFKFRQPENACRIKIRGKSKQSNYRRESDKWINIEKRTMCYKRVEQIQLQGSKGKWGVKSEREIKSTRALSTKQFSSWKMTAKIRNSCLATQRAFPFRCAKGVLSFQNTVSLTRSPFSNQLRTRL